MTGFSSTASMCPASKCSDASTSLPPAAPMMSTSAGSPTGGREREQARVAVEAVEARDVAVEAVDAGAEEGVVVEHAHVAARSRRRRRGRSGSTRRRSCCRRRAATLVASSRWSGRTDGATTPTSSTTHSPAATHATRGRTLGREPCGAEREDETGEQDRRRRADPAEQRHDDRTRDAGTEEIGEVEPADLL